MLAINYLSGRTYWKDGVKQRRLAGNNLGAFLKQKRAKRLRVNNLTLLVVPRPDNVPRK